MTLETAHGEQVPASGVRCTGGRQGNAGDHGGGIGVYLTAYQSHPRSPLLTRSSHVALLRGGLRCCCLIAGKYQQETSCSEPTSLRPLQAQKESVPFPGHPYCLFMRIYSSLLIGLCPRSPLSVAFFVIFLSGVHPCHSAGDGTSSRAKCRHCLSSSSVCIFTESTKVCPLPLVSALLWLSTWLSQTRGPPKWYIARYVIFVAYLISNL